jgi:hypothetical protein
MQSHQGRTRRGGVVEDERDMFGTVGPLQIVSGREQRIRELGALL